MQKRAALARALSKQAEIYLLDEPTGGQDSDHADTIAKAINQYTSGSLCIISTHDYALIPKVADTILTIRDGRINFTSVAKQFV